MTAQSFTKLPSNAAVTLYLMGVGASPMLTGKAPIPFLGRRRLLRLGPRTRATLSNPHHERGFCYVARIPPALVPDARGRPQLLVLEDGKPLPFDRSTLEAIRQMGKGRYAQSEAEVSFSASDNSDPSTNGRLYSVEER